MTVYQLNLAGIIQWLTSNWIILAVVAAWAGSTYGWYRFRTWGAERGRAIRPLGQIIRNIVTFAITDNRPVLTKPAALADKTRWLQGRYLYAILALIAVATHLTGHDAWRNTLIVAIAAGITFRARPVFASRWATLNQMYAVANAAFRYPKGSDTQPWSYIKIAGWDNNTRPRTVTVVLPAGTNAADPNFRTKFENNWTGAITNANSWDYEWEPHNNRVLAEPTPLLPETATYPGVDRNPWNMFALGVAGAGKEAAWDVKFAPHILICGPTGTGKIHPTDEPILSSRGWTTIGELVLGDKVPAPDGTWTEVTGFSAVEENPELYELLFSDGSTSNAGAGHLWFTSTRAERETVWTAVKRGVAVNGRKPLLDAETVARLRAEAAAAAHGSEVTVTEAAVLAGVSPTTAWLRALADECGPVAETNVAYTAEYAAQTVVQAQTVSRVDARAVWGLLAGYEPSRPSPAWYALRPEMAVMAAQAAPDAEVSSREVASLLGSTPKKVGTLLRDAGVPSRTEKGVAWWPAAGAWGYFARTGQGKADWDTIRAAAVRELAAAMPGSTVRVTDAAALCGITPEYLSVLLRKANIPTVASREDVNLAVPAKTVAREGRVVNTYDRATLLARVAEYGERLPYDQRDKAHPSGRIRTTLEILETLHAPGGQANHSLPAVEPLQFSEQDLPVDPYVLGVWLGDGYSRQGGFCGIDHDIAREIERRGHVLHEHRVRGGRHEDFRIWRVEGLQSALHRDLGLIRTRKDNTTRKHVPDVYLYGSIQQRRDLLAGLLDTDGTVEPQGTVAFTNTNRALVDAVLFLARSLGYLPYEQHKTPAKDTHKDAWTVRWTCAESPFLLPRKTALHTERNARLNAERNGRRYIVDVRPIPSRPARCIIVDHPSHQYLVGRDLVPTHNSVLQRTILLHALQSPTWRILGVDPKKVEMTWLKDKSNVLKITTDLFDSVDLVDDVEKEMHRRYEVMEAARVNHFLDLPDPPPAILMMIDEVFAFLSPEGIKSDEGKERDAAHARAAILIGSIARLGRAAGIHLALATQRPDATILKGELKNNLDARVAAGRMDTTPSLMVLDSEAATRLPAIKGRGLYRAGQLMQEFQGYFLPLEKVDDVIAEAQAWHEANPDGAVSGGGDDGGGAGGGKSKGLRLPKFGRKAKIEAHPVVEDAEDFGAAGPSPLDEEWVPPREASGDADGYRDEDTHAQSQAANMPPQPPQQPVAPPAAPARAGSGRVEDVELPYDDPYGGYDGPDPFNGPGLVPDPASAPRQPRQQQQQVADPFTVDGPDPFNPIPEAPPAAPPTGGGLRRPGGLSRPSAAPAPVEQAPDPSTQQVPPRQGPPPAEPPPRPTGGGLSRR